MWPRSVPRSIGEQQLDVHERGDSLERRSRAVVTLVESELLVSGIESFGAFFGQPEQEALAVCDLRPVPLSRVEELPDVAGVGERVARSCRRHGPQCST